MDKKLKVVYLRGYEAAIKSLVGELKKQIVKIAAEIERCLKREDEKKVGSYSDVPLIRTAELAKNGYELIFFPFGITDSSETATFLVFFNVYTRYE